MAGCTPPGNYRKAVIWMKIEASLDREAREALEKATEAVWDLAEVIGSVIGMTIKRNSDESKETTEVEIQTD